MRTARITPLETGGDHYTVGRALGAAGAAALRERIPRIERFRALLGEWLGSDRLATLEAAGRRAFPQYMREIEGIADGAGMPFEQVFLWNCRGDLPGGGDQTQATSLGCTTVLIPGEGDAPAIIAHNEDDQVELDGHCFFVHATLENGAAFHSFYAPGLLPGHTFAVNRHALVQAINHIRPHDQRAGVPRHLVCRAILDCETLDQALTLLQADTRASGFHHNLGQAGDTRLLSVEAPASGCAVETAHTPRAHTNHLLFEPFENLAQTRAPSSAKRQQRAVELIADGALAGRDPLCVLGDQAGGEYPVYRKHLAPISRRPTAVDADPGHTLATAIFRITGDSAAYEVYADIHEPAEHHGRCAITPGADMGRSLHDRRRQG